MSRTAFALRGWQGTTGDTRCYFPNAFLNQSPSNGFIATFDEAIPLAWRDVSLDVDINVTWDDGSGPQPVVFSGSFPIFWLVADPIESEIDIGCQPRIEWIMDSSVGSIKPYVLITIRMDSFDPITKLYLFGVTLNYFVVTGGIDNVVQAAPGGIGGSGIAFNCLGHGIALYDYVGASSGAIDITVGSYFGYASTGVANPIYDVSTGVQLITPVPLQF